MQRQGSTRWLRWVIPPAIVAVTLACTSISAAGSRSDPTRGLTAATGSNSVPAWARRNATAIDSVDPGAPLDDLASLQRSIGDARIVGLGESRHGAAEELALKHRVLRLLVERMGFRSIAWEEQWTVGLQLNRYIGTGAGDLAALMRQMGSQWNTDEVAAVLRWLRDFNSGRSDKVQFVGVEYYLTPPRAYDDVESYVARTAPGRLQALQQHLPFIRPRGSDMYKYIGWYAKRPDKQVFINHARAVQRLVRGIPHRAGDRAHALTLQTTRQIVSFYQHYRLPAGQQDNFRDAHTSRNLRWWRDFAGDKIAFWAASPHTANAPHLRMTLGPAADLRFPSAGSYLRRWYGRDYLSIGFTFDHGAVSDGPGSSLPMPEPAANWFERPFGEVPLAQFSLDLRDPAPAAVRCRLRTPMPTRGLPVRDARTFMDGGSLRQWFDVIVHRQVVTPARSRPFV